MTNGTRQPNVSGAFYSDDPNQLRALINHFLDKAPANKELNPRAFIVPHAGHVYSGPTAAYVYKIIENIKPDNIIIIGPCHHMYFNGISVDEMDSYETPLGMLDINTQIANQIREKSTLFTYEEPAHKKEHCLEVQLPFIQVVSPQSKIVPVLIGNVGIDDLNLFAQELADILQKNEKTIILASSDFSHFHNGDMANAMDDKAIKSILDFNIESLIDDNNKRKAEMCGLLAAITTILTMMRIGAYDAKLLDRSNSGDITKDYNSVVGYASISFSKAVIDNTELKKEEKMYLINLVRYKIRNELGISSDQPQDIESPILDKKRGAFVTLHKHGQLRGCIGYIQAIKDLRSTIKEMAISAAFKDPRFAPVTKEEEKELDIEISILSELELITDTNKIVVGKHGLVIRDRGYSGLLLPQVATEYGWDRETFLKQTCNKAGLPHDAWQKGAQIYIFSADIFDESVLDR